MLRKGAGEITANNSQHEQPARAVLSAYWRHELWPFLKHHLNQEFSHWDGRLDHCDYSYHVIVANFGIPAGNDCAAARRARAATDLTKPASAPSHSHDSSGNDAPSLVSNPLHRRKPVPTAKVDPGLRRESAEGTSSCINWMNLCTSRLLNHSCVIPGRPVRGGPETMNTGQAIDFSGPCS